MNVPSRVKENEGFNSKGWLDLGKTSEKLLYNLDKEGKPNMEMNWWAENVLAKRIVLRFSNQDKERLATLPRNNAESR